MTDRALDDLIAAIETNSGIAWGHVEHLPRKALGSHWETALNAYLGSLDAAKSLHDALIPDWQIGTFHLGGEVSMHLGDPQMYARGSAMDNVARAWLIAILRAYRGMQG